jgi:hypothetical protein
MNVIDRASVLACILIATAVSTAQAGVTDITVTSVERFAEGAAFGQTGAYERVKGTFRGELDPADARNQVIVNLDRAPRNARGRVEYESDFFLLRPVDPARGNGKLLYDVVNRGRMYVHWRLMDAKLASAASGNDPRTLADAGNGLLLRMGFTLAWSGWDPDAPRTNNGLAMKPVIATNGGAPIVRTIRDELTSGLRAPARETLRLTYEAATLDQGQARLTKRRHQGDAREPVPAGGWAYVNAREIRLLPEGTKPEPGTLYEFHYPAKDPRVLGIGFAATRDFVAFLRNATRDEAGHPNPAGTGIKNTLAFGVSQSGRFLRDFVYQGFNQDESARRVFDGMLAHTAGVGGVFLNAEFGQPARTNTQHEDHTFPENAFPFSTARLTDPVTGKTAGLLRGDGFDPLWMETNTSTEYWQKGASLLVTDPLATYDLELPRNARAFLIAGTQHGGRAWMTSTKGPCANPRNPHSPTPALRALLVALSEWTDGRTPPDSRTPRLRDATLVTPQQVKFPALPGVQVARRMNEFGVLTDWVQPAMNMAKPYRPLVTQVDADGNENTGVLLPDIAVPLATYTGWNLYAEPYPAGALCDRDGTYSPFAATRAAREAANDPRASVEERYASHAAYVARVDDTARKLVAARLLLPEDAERFMTDARSPDVAKRFPR